MANPSKTQKIREILDSEKQDIVVAINACLESKSISANTLVKNLDMNAGTLSKMRNSEWENISDEMWRKVKNYCKEWLPKAEWKIAKTNTLATVVKVCTDAKEKSHFLMIIGNAGAGKTKAAKYVCSKNESTSQNSFYVESVSTETFKDFVNSIAKTIGMENLSGSAGAKTRRIADYLNSLEKPLLVIDEGGGLSNKKFSFVKSLWNLTEESCGIVLMGVEYMWEDLKRKAAKGESDIPEFLSRLAYKPTKVERISLEEMTALLQHNDFRATEESELAEYRKIYKWLHEHTRADLRMIKNMVLRIKKEFPDSVITLELLKEKF